MAHKTKGAQPIAPKPAPVQKPKGKKKPPLSALRLGFGSSRLGTKFRFMSPSARPGTDKLRTALGNVWTKKQESATAAGSKAKFRKLKNQEILNRMAEKKALEKVAPEMRETERKRWRSHLRDRESPTIYFPDGLLFDTQIKIMPDGSEKRKIIYTGSKKQKKAMGSFQAFESDVEEITKKMVEDIFSGMKLPFEDYGFEFVTPLSREVGQKMNTGNSHVKASFASQEVKYNYYFESYEQMTAAVGSSETDLPNVYAISMIQRLSEETNRTPNRNAHLDKEMYAAVSLFDRIPKGSIFLRAGRNDENTIKAPRKLGNVKKNKRSVDSNSSYMDYLDQYIKAFKVVDAAEVDLLRQKNSTLIFSINDYDSMLEISNKDKNLPMSIALEFATTPLSPGTSFANLLKKGNFSTILAYKLIESQFDAGESPSRNLTAPMLSALGEQPTLMLGARAKKHWFNFSLDFYKQKYSLSGENVVGSIDEGVGKLNTKALDLVEFLKDLMEDGAQNNIDERVKDFSTAINSGKEIPLSFEKQNMKASLTSFILSGQLRKMAKDKIRTIDEMFNGASAPSEVIFYQIEKYRLAGVGEPELVQTFLVPNFLGKDTIKIIDSQVKFDSIYKYNISAWTIVFGNMYQYLDFEPTIGEVDKKGDFLDGLNYTISNDPVIRLIKLPYYEYDPIRTRDFPPVPPDVDFVPFRGVNNRILINLNHGIGSYKDMPVALSSDDHIRWRRNYESQYGLVGADKMTTQVEGIQRKSTPLQFSSDDLPKRFEIFRIDFPPFAWSDFEDSRAAILDVEVGETAYIDSLSPNIIYYYMCRTIDIHGNVSNPSGIFKVKIVDDQGIFPIIEPYEMDKDKRLGRTFKKTVRRYVHITPAFDQILFEDDRPENQKKTIANAQKVRLGRAEDSVYGKTLKFRMTSKHSGKKIDFNVSFSHVHEKPPK